MSSPRVRRDENNKKRTINLNIIWMEDLPFGPDCRYIIPNILAVSTLEPLLKKGKSGSFPGWLPHVFFI